MWQKTLRTLLTSSNAYSISFYQAIKPPKNPSPLSKVQEFQIGQRIQARFFIDNKCKWKFRSVVRRLRRVYYIVELDNGYTLKRHTNPLKLTEVSEK